MKENLFRNIEQKYNFVGQQKTMILDWLEHCYTWDPVFEFGTISTLYYDTPTMSLYNEKRNSDYLKSKVRLRWYENLLESNRSSEVKCYLEVKQKIGSVRQKLRSEHVIASGKLINGLFSDEEILNLPSKAYELNYFPRGLLVPMILIQYNRYRFIDTHTNSRIALDTDIHSECVNVEYFPVSPPVHLDMGVLEIKGKQRNLLNTLIPMSCYLTKAAFSKYAQCLEHLMQPLNKRR